MSSQGFRRRKDDGRGTVPSTPRVELKGSIVLIFDPTTPIQTYTVVARLCLSFAVLTARLLFAALYFSGLTRPTSRISNVDPVRDIPLAYQQPVLLLFLGSGAPSFFGRGMVEMPAWYWLGGKGWV